MAPSLPGQIARETISRVHPDYIARLRGSRGHDFRVQELWLAAQALERKFTLLTANVKDFKDVPGLKLVAVNSPGA